MQALKKVGKKGKREERETHSFLISLLDSLPPSPPFFYACHLGYFEDGAAKGSEHRFANLAI